VKVRFAVSIGLGGPEPDALSSVVRQAEALGFDTLWFSDVPSVGSVNPLLGVAFVGAHTTKVKLGINLIPFGYSPYRIANELAQLDRLVSGRLLVTIVPGLETPEERASLGTFGRHRGRMIEELLPRLRAWWAGEALRVGEGLDLALPAKPLQDPLEVWLGGSGPEAVERAGRFSDGWLGSLVTPQRAGEIRAGIQDAAERAGRRIDPEHFGLSIGYARVAEDLDNAVRLRRPRQGGGDIQALVPVGREPLREFAGRLIEQGISKFVVRRVAPVGSWDDELEWLAGTVLDLQT
jgi:probable F420-dependent oxidoreductase